MCLYWPQSVRQQETRAHCCRFRELLVMHCRNVNEIPANRHSDVEYCKHFRPFSLRRRWSIEIEERSNEYANLRIQIRNQAGGHSNVAGLAHTNSRPRQDELWVCLVEEVSMKGTTCIQIRYTCANDPMSVKKHHRRMPIIMSLFRLVRSP